MNNDSLFPRWLDLTLENRGISARRLAKRMKIHDSAVSRWRSGQVSPSLDTVMKLAQELNVDALRLAVTAGLLDSKIVGKDPLPLPEPTVQRGRVREQLGKIKGATDEERQILIEAYDSFQSRSDGLT